MNIESSKVQFFLYESVEFSDDRLLEGGLRIDYKADRFDLAAFGRNITNDESAVSASTQQFDRDGQRAAHLGH